MIPLLDFSLASGAQVLDQTLPISVSRLFVYIAIFFLKKKGVRREKIKLRNMGDLFTL